MLLQKVNVISICKSSVPFLVEYHMHKNFDIHDTSKPRFSSRSYKAIVF
jgi:hypothetical protein